MTVHDAKLVCASYLLFDGESYCDRCVGHGLSDAPCGRVTTVLGPRAAPLLSSRRSIVGVGMYRPVDRFICPSTFLASKLRQAQIYPDRLRVIPHFIDTHGVAIGGTTRNGVVYAGRLDRTKGPQVLIEAAGLRNDMIVDVLGDGPDRARSRSAG